MASRAWASAEAVTVQVLTTTISAAAGVAAEVQPRSSNWRSRAAPSAWGARAPNCWVKKGGIWNHRTKPRKTYTEVAECAENAEKGRFHAVLTADLDKDSGLGGMADD